MTPHALSAFERAALALVVLVASSAGAGAQTTATGAPAVLASPETPADRDQSHGRFLKGRFLLGIQGGPVWSVDSKLDNLSRVSPVVRYNSRRTGWGPTFSLGWMNTTLSAQTGSAAAPVARLKLRPVMAGVGYTWQAGRARLTAGGVAGYAFNDATLDTALPEGVIASVRVRNAWAAGPKAGVLFALTDRLALTASAACVFTDPEVQVRVTRNGAQVYSSSDHVRGDFLSVRLGVAVSLF